MKIRPDIPIVTELVSPQNLGFLINNAKDYATMKKYGQVNVTKSISLILNISLDANICGRVHISIFNDRQSYMSGSLIYLHRFLYLLY